MKPELKAKLLQLLLFHCQSVQTKSEKGFTLIELLVVMMIIGLLSAIAMPSFLSQSNKARQSEAKTYVGAINRGQQTYFLEKNTFANLSNLNLGISDSRNYTYVSQPSGSGINAAADTIAFPVGTVRGYAGKVWIHVGLDNNATSLSLVCEGTAGTPPTISGTTCPNI